MITGMEKSSSNKTHAVTPPSEKNEESQTRKNDCNYRSVIGLLKFLTNQRAPGCNARFISARNSELI